jgi:hypothetical protein
MYNCRGNHAGGIVRRRVIFGLIVSLIFAYGVGCDKAPQASGSGEFRGLEPSQFEAILDIAGPEVPRLLAGIKRTPTAATSGLVALPDGSHQPFQGIISMDRQDRWLRMDWEAPHEDCRKKAQFHCEMHWANLKALTGEGVVTATCNGEFLVKSDVKISLLYDPKYVK